MASYKVKNEAGQEFEVDEDKIGEAEKDGYLPVVTNGKQEHRVSFGDIALAKKDGFLPKTDDSLMEAKDTFFDSMNQMIPGSGLIDKAAAATYAGMQEVGDIFRDDANKKDFKERYQGALDKQDTERKVMDEKYPVASTAGTVAGIVPNAMIPVPFGAGKGLVGAGQRIMANTAISAADEATRNKDELIDEDRGLEGGTVSGGVSAAVESLPLVGKVAKAAKRLIPATEGAYDIVNKGVAKLGSLIPGTDIQADELAEVMTDVTSRRQARSVLKNPEKTKELSERVVKTLNVLDNATTEQMGVAYDAAEMGFIQKVKPKDARQLLLAGNSISQVKGIVGERPELFGRAKRVIDNVDDILKRGSEKEIGEVTAGKTFQELIELGVPTNLATQQYANRLLSARRYIDDVTKNVDYDKMLKTEKEYILKTRGFINNALDEIPAARELRKTDNLYSEYMKQKKNALNKLETPLPGGGREFTPEKIEQFLKSDAAQAKFIERELEKFTDFMSNPAFHKGDVLSGVIQANVDAARQLGKMGRSLDDLKRASGGPSSQAINTVGQLLALKSTGGASLLLLPITNPSAWMRLVDGASSVAEKEFLKKVGAASRQVMDKLPPSVVTRMYMMGKDEE